MPLTSKGEEIKSNMEKEYGKGKGESVFYASANKGTIKGVHNDRSNNMSNSDGGAGSGPQSSGGSGSEERKEHWPPRPMGARGQDQTQPDPATGPMSTKGPSGGKSEGLPEAATPSSHPAKDTVGSAMSVDAIKDMGKRIGRY